MSPSDQRVDAVVVGSGPNGLAAAVTLAQAGLSVTVLEAAPTIGGGTRTEELTVPGVLHDVCSAVHPLALASPFLRRLPMAEHGLEWRWPEIDLAHPLDDGRVAVMKRSLERTVEDLGADGAAWRRFFGPLVDGFAGIADDVLRPRLRRPRHVVGTARFALRGAAPASVVTRAFREDGARALFAGCAAHAIRPLDRPLTSAVATLLITAGHAVGWPVAAGGSVAITRALASLLRAAGGMIETGVDVRSWRDLPPARITMFDTSPRAFTAIAGERVPARVRRAFTGWRYGPAAFKVDLAVEGGIPWTAEGCRRAGTVHVGGTFEEIAAAEAAVWRGAMPERPFVLVSQQYLCDPLRSVGDVHPIWAYAHVPHGSTVDSTDAIIDQIERFAPGTRDRIVGRHVAGPALIEATNANHVGGDIAAGASTVRQLILRPRPTFRPYATGVPGAYLCSASTPPGPGVHGMCGHLAALAALRDLGPDGPG